MNKQVKEEGNPEVTVALRGWQEKEKEKPRTRKGTHDPPSVDHCLISASQADPACGHCTWHSFQWYSSPWTCLLSSHPCSLVLSISYQHVSEFALSVLCFCFFFLFPPLAWIYRGWPRGKSGVAQRALCLDTFLMHFPTKFSCRNFSSLTLFPWGWLFQADFSLFHETRFLGNLASCKDPYSPFTCHYRIYVLHVIIEFSSSFLNLKSGPLEDVSQKWVDVPRMNLK